MGPAALPQKVGEYTDGDPRGPFYGMGVCFECEVTVDGSPGVRACITKIYAGMRVETAAEGEVPHDR